MTAVKKATNMNKVTTIIVSAGMLLMSGCLNMPTQPSQITGMDCSTVTYENLTPSQLHVELDSLSRRESELELAQQQRIKTSQMQAFWYWVWPR